MEEMNAKTKRANSTTVVMLNTRNIGGYQSLQEMQKPESKGLWGNQISFLQIPIPKVSQSKISNPLEFVWNSRELIKRKRRPFSIYLVALLMDLEMRLRGPEVCDTLIFNYSSKILMFYLISFINNFENQESTSRKIIHEILTPCNFDHPYWGCVSGSS